MVLKQRIFVLLLSVSACINSYNVQAQNDNSNKNNITIGVNLLTPLGSLQESSYTRISELSTNACASFHIEYRRSSFALRVPVRVPLTQFEEPTTPTNSYYGYGRESYTNYEVGILPTLYFLDKSKPLQFYSYLGIYIGNNYGIAVTTIDHYGYNPASGNYTEFINVETLKTKLPNRMYNRYALGSGISHQFDNGLGFEADLSVYFGRIYQISQSGSSNYNTTDGAYTNSYMYNRFSTIFSTQFGLNITYQLL